MNEVLVNIRPGKIAEHAEILTLWEDSVRASHDFITEADIDDYRKLIADRLPDLKLFCLEEAGRLQAFIAISNRKIQLLFVHPRAFRQGFGKHLTHFAIQQHHVWMVDVNAQNERAVSFYLNMGFHVHEKFATDGLNKPYPVWELRLNKIRDDHQKWMVWKKKVVSLFQI